MPEYEVSQQARRELRGIVQFSFERFGRYQAEAYLAGFEKTFGLLADFPRMGRASEDLGSGMRRFRFQSHYILYSALDDHVVIRSVIHVRRNLRLDLIE